MKSHILLLLSMFLLCSILAFSQELEEVETAAIQNSVTDVDGNTYKTVRIGDQEWMAENLRVTKFRNNAAIAHIDDAFDWSRLATPAWRWYQDDAEQYEADYGKMYNWFTVIDTQGLCPTGWRVPTDNDWITLMDFLGGIKLAGALLKEAGNDHWASHNSGATNESGFTGLPGGYCSSSGSFGEIGNNGFWWSSTEVNDKVASITILNYLDDKASIDTVTKRFGLSVRCVRE